MVLIIIENTEGVCSALDKFTDYPKMARGYITRASKKEDLNCFIKPPLIKSGWLLKCSNDLSENMLYALKEMPDNNFYIFTVQNQTLYNILSARLNAVGIQFKVIDNSKPPMGNVVNWIMSEINTDIKTAEKIYKRSNGYMKQIIYNVGILSTLKEVTSKDVTKYTRVRNSDSVFNLALLMLGESDISKKDAIVVIYNFQYASDYLLKYLTDLFKDYINVFSLISDGILTIDNYMLVKKEKRYNIDKINRYRLIKMIEMYDSISISKLYYIYTQLCRIDSNRYSLYKLIALLNFKE